MECAGLRVEALAGRCQASRVGREARRSFCVALSGRRRQACWDWLPTNQQQEILPCSREYTRKELGSVGAPLRPVCSDKRCRHGDESSDPVRVRRSRCTGCGELVEGGQRRGPGHKSVDGTASQRCCNISAGCRCYDAENEDVVMRADRLSCAVNGVSALCKTAQFLHPIPDVKQRGPRFYSLEPPAQKTSTDPPSERPKTSGKSC
ncbi:hypothetical protein SKAU_G00296670 [Synaphobranchus kaupii]|uniref:Uncharacterized protein n=1 Tax=Synaphobranchus kaupii TaxID=118154 RepID=A0A9Q1EUS7_SYNKA|nr:hypothetical protein SKAU_G00296670 [Synaphobranchus kaupii]